MITAQRHHQALRRLRGARRRLARGPDGLADGAARAQSARASRRCCASSPGSRRPTAATRRDRRRATPPALPPQQRGIGFVFQHYAAFKHMTVRENVAFGLSVRKRPEGRDRRARRRAARDRRARRLRGPLPVAALRRPAPAHGARPRAGGRAARAAARRAVRRARREGPRRAARVAAAPARRGPRDDRARHARPGGGDGGRRPDRGDERRPHRAGRRARASSTSSPANDVRHGLPRAGHASSAASSCARTTSRIAPTPRDGRRRGAWSTRVVHLGFEVRVELELADGGAVCASAHARRGRGARARDGRHRVRRAACGAAGSADAQARPTLTLSA